MWSIWQLKERILLPEWCLKEPSDGTELSTVISTAKLYFKEYIDSEAI
jgi:hypothetical protein